LPAACWANREKGMAHGPAAANRPPPMKPANSCEFPVQRQGGFCLPAIEGQAPPDDRNTLSSPARLDCSKACDFIRVVRRSLTYNMPMSQDDYDVDRLAEYLHMMPAAVLKLAERGKLPGRRVAGQWRFSAAEVHHWLEDRIGLSDDDELAKVEGALDRASTSAEPDEICIVDLLHREAIETPLDARTRGSVITRMTELAARTHLLWHPAQMADAVRAREDMHSTALDIGVALLHPRRPMSSILESAVLALGVTPRGIPFGTGGSLTDIFFLICSTSDHEHLRILARLSRVISDQDFLTAIRSAENAAALDKLVRDRDAALRRQV
jgi:nitrogen PTS system EIIA component